MFLHHYLKNLDISYSKPLKKKWVKVIKKKFFLYKKLKATSVVNTNPSFKNTQKLTQLLTIYTTFGTHKTNHLNYQFFWFFLYQQSYFSLLFKTPVVLKNINALDVVPRSLLVYMINSIKHVRLKKYNIIHSNEIVEILFLSLWLKNLKLFMEWMRKYFEKSNLKRHRKLFLLLNLLLGRFIWSYNLFLQLKGLRLILRGKFGKAGSVRKTRKYIKRGKCSYTTKKIAIINQTNIIRTLTGVFSIKFEVFF